MTYDIIQEFKEANAFIEGHFILSSGLHSPLFLQKNWVMMDPVRAERACKALAQKITEHFGKIDIVLSPAIGGIIPGYETARHLGAKAMFVERDKGKFTLRRGFSFTPSDRVILVEDIITTGLSSRETIEAIAPHEKNLVGAACLIDRSAGKASLGMKHISLAEIDIPTYTSETLPEELKKQPVTKPGSRSL